METSLRKCENAILRAPSLEINDLQITDFCGGNLVYLSLSPSLSPLSHLSLTRYLSLFVTHSLSSKETVYISDV